MFFLYSLAMRASATKPICRAASGVNTKLGAEWKSPASRFGLDKRGHLGIQFDSGYRMSLRLRKSGVGVYVRGQF